MWSQCCWSMDHTLKRREQINSLSFKILILDLEIHFHLLLVFPFWALPLHLETVFGHFHSFPLAGQEVNRERCKSCRMANTQQRKQKVFRWRLTAVPAGRGKWCCLFPSMMCRTGTYYHAGNGPNINKDARDQGLTRDWSQQMARYRQELRSISFLCHVKSFNCVKLPFLKTHVSGLIHIYTKSPQVLLYWTNFRFHFNLKITGISSGTDSEKPIPLF